LSFPDLQKYSLREIAQRVSRRSLGPALVRLTAARDYDLAETLVVAGSPRSGTTWLAEVLGTLPRSAILFEPEHMLQVPDARKAGLDWHVLKLPGDAWPEGDTYFDRVLRGRVVTPWTVSHLPLSRAIAPRRWIVKFVDANLMLGWLATRFPLRPPVLVLRHPCAVVGSQLRRGWQLEHAPRLAAFFDRYPQFKEYVAALKDPIEWSTAHWCIHTYVPLILPQPRPFIVTTYEQATREPEQEFSRLFEKWHLPMPADLVNRTRRPSGTTDLGSGLLKPKDADAGWRKTLTPTQVRQVLAVVRAFGLDFYTDDPQPDASRLAGPCPIQGGLG
jgi:Sulfotransferase family